MTLQAIELRNFKCYEALDLPCSALTVLTGYNAAGKSTVLQALLLLAQGLRTAASEKTLPLNGDLVRLRSEGDVLCHGAADSSFTLGVRSASERIRWTFGSQKAPSSSGFVPLHALEYRQGRGSDMASPQEEPEQIWPVHGEAKSPLASAVRDAAYVGASRAITSNGFSALQEASQSADDTDTAGQFAPRWYVEYADEGVDPARHHPQDASGTVKAQVDAWLSELFPGARATADRLSPDAARLSFSLDRDSQWEGPASAGSGLSAAFPILVALLTRAKGSIVVVDSAESHLHPGAQSAVGRFLGQMAGAGLQIFVETNSEHVLNGIRLAVRGGLLQPSDVALHFVGQGGVVGQVTTLGIDRNGTVNNWPAGFFDQAESDLATLSGWKGIDNADLR